MWSLDIKQNCKCVIVWQTLHSLILHHLLLLLSLLLSKSLQLFPLSFLFRFPHTLRLLQLILFLTTPIHRQHTLDEFTFILPGRMFTFSRLWCSGIKFWETICFHYEIVQSLLSTHFILGNGKFVLELTFRILTL